MIKVGVAVFVGSGVTEAVSVGRNVQVARGVGVNVLVEVGVEEGSGVIVTNTRVFVAIGVGDGEL